MNCSQGDIILLPFPFTDLSNNSKRRPAIVISNSLVNKTDDVICALITSNLRNDEFSYKLDNKDLATALKVPSEIRCHRLFTADKNIVVKKISSLNKGKHKSLIDKIVAFIEPK